MSFLEDFDPDEDRIADMEMKAEEHAEAERLRKERECRANTKPVVSKPNDSTSEQLDGQLWNHLYAIWSADDMKLDELNYRKREIEEYIAKQRRLARIETLKDVMRETETGDVSIWVYKWAKQQISQLQQPEQGDKHE